ncbi:MAG: hypothetical protein EOL95_05100 [Bacteroidia bacterium]|nr:hypothetical protein [Bacteroidia bacterium]
MPEWKVNFIVPELFNRTGRYSTIYPVKSDATRILTCVLEYFENKVRVTDLLNEFEDGQWEQKVSSYFKIRLSKEAVIKMPENLGLKIQYNKTEKGIINLVVQK